MTDRPSRAEADAEAYALGDPGERGRYQFARGPVTGQLAPEPTRADVLIPHAELLDLLRTVQADADRFLDRCQAAAGTAFDAATWATEWPGFSLLTERN